MNTISIETLLRCFEKYSPVLVNCNKRSEIVFSSVSKTLALNTERHDVLYIIKKINKITEIKNASGYICFDSIKNIELIKMSGKPLLLLSTPKDAVLTDLIKTVYETIISLIYQFGAAREEMMNALAGGANLQSIINTATKIINSPIVIMDSCFSYIAHSTSKIQNPIWDNDLSLKRVRQEVINSIKSSNIWGDLHCGKDYTVQYLENGVTALRLPIIIKHKLIAILGVYNYDKPFCAEVIDLSKIICKSICAYFQRDYFFLNSKDDKNELLLYDILQNNINSKEIIRRINEQKLLFSNNMILLCICPSNNASQKEGATLNFFRNRLDTILCNGNSLIFQNNIIKVIDLDNSYHLDNITKEKINAFLEHDKMYGGMSKTFYDISQLKTYFLQALTAIRLSRLHGENYQLFDYKDIMVEHMVNVCEEKINMISLIHDSIIILNSYDRKYKTSYLESLRVLVDCMGNMSLAAKKIGVHYNTIKYRINMIREITDMPNMNINLITQLFISFKIWDQIKTTCSEEVLEETGS